jgi:hypothetical protein
MEEMKGRKLNVKLSDLVEAYEFIGLSPGENHAYIHWEFGKIECVSPYSEIDSDVFDLIQNTDHYIQIPDQRKLNVGSRTALSFAEEVIPIHYDRIHRMFQRRGAFRHFKNFLEDIGMLKKWYEYHNAVVKDALTAWCNEEGIEIQ